MKFLPPKCVNRMPLLILLSAALFGITRIGGAQCWDTTRTIDNPTPANTDYFGYAVSMAAGKVLVGAHFDDTAATDAGSAYLFDMETGAPLKTFLSPAPTVNDRFGLSVALSEQYALIGAILADTGGHGSGAALLFDATTGSLLRQLTDPVPGVSGHFGGASAIEGTTLVVGAPYDSSAARFAGKAHVFNAVTGSLVTSLSPPSPMEKDHFGDCVAISGGKVLVGAYLADAGAVDAGAAFLFDSATGALLHTFSNPNPKTGANFGRTIAISGNHVLIGASLDDTDGHWAGIAYLFDADTGLLARTLHNPFPAVGAGFGGSLAVSANTILVTAVGADGGGLRFSGAGYIFDVATGTLLQTLSSPAPFGSAAAIANDTFVAGAPYAISGGVNAGGVFIFKNDPSTPCPRQILDYILDIRPNSPVGLDVNQDGVVDMADVIAAYLRP